MTTTDSLMKQLDDVIANRDIYLKQKEARLSELHSNLLSEDNDRGRFDVLNHMFREYIPFNTDSAYNISLRQAALAKRIGDNNLLQNARMNRANIFGATGMYHECLNLMDSVPFDVLPDYLRPYYYHIRRTA